VLTVERPPVTWGDRGASTLATLGVVIVAALLVTGAVVGVAAYPGSISSALCRFAAAAGLSPGSCDAAAPEAVAPKTDEDFRPPVCMLEETSEQYSAEVKVWFLSFGENSGFIVQEFSDGTVRATATDGASVGAGGAITSKTFDAGKLGGGDNAGVDIDLGGGLKFSYGDTWEFESADQWKDMKGQLDDYLLQQEMLKQEGGAYAVMAMGWEDPPKPAQVSFTKLELEAALNASAGLREPTGTVGDDGKETFIDPNVGVTLEASAGTAVILETNHETGEQSWTFELTGSGSVGAEAVVGQVQAEGEIQGALTVTRNKKGELTQIVMQTSHEGGFAGGFGNDTSENVSGSGDHTETDSTVTTTTLDVTDSNRSTVEDWLGARSTGATLALPFAAAVPDAPSDDPFQQLLYEQARTSAITYHNVSDKWEFEAAVKKGWQFGMAISGETATSSATDANFLGAPGTDGTRPLIPDSTCK
jgi:hypothetical protein